MINSLDNIDSQAIPPLERAIAELNEPDPDMALVGKLVALAHANTLDVTQVLAPDLHQSDAAVHVADALAKLQGLTPQKSRLCHAADLLCDARLAMHTDPCTWKPDVDLLCAP